MLLSKSTRDEAVCIGKVHIYLQYNQQITNWITLKTTVTSISDLLFVLCSSVLYCIISAVLVEKE
jgi:hypothetical protein